MPFLDWVNKNQAKAVSSEVPYHLLQKEAEFGTPSKDNMIIQGDNLLALRALMPLYGGQVKCIFIDPPTIPNLRLSITTISLSIVSGYQ